MPFFAGMAPAEIAAIQAAGTVRHYRPGGRIHPAGRGRRELLILLQGQVTVSQRITRSQTKILAVQGPGRLVGGLSGLLGVPSPFVTTALRASVGLAIPLDALEALALARPSLGVRVFGRLLEEAADRVRILDEHFLTLSRLYLEYRPASRRCPVFSQCLAVTGQPTLQSAATAHRPSVVERRKRRGAAR